MNRLPWRAEPPIAVQLVATALIVNGLSAAVLGWELLETDQIVIGLAHVTLAVALLGRAVAIWRQRTGVYAITLALLVVRVCLAVLAFATAAITTESVVSLVLALGALLYLLQPRVRECFN
jgi:hypothetical protein